MLFAAEELDELKRAFAQHLEEGPVGHMAAMALVLGILYHPVPIFWC